MASNNNFNFKTRAGLIPDTDELPYTITTQTVQKYLQDKVNVVVDGMRKQGTYNGEDIEVRVITVEMGRSFYPFTVALPPAVLEEYHKKTKRNNELSIFNPKDNDQTVSMLRPLSQLFGSYLYNENDDKAFSSPDWRRARGVNTTTTIILKQNRLPKLTTISRNGSLERVTFLIDPLRVFYDMLIVDNNNADFNVDIVEWKKIRSAEFRYKVMRRIINKKKGKKNGSSFVDELSRSMCAFSGKK